MFTDSVKLRITAGKGGNGVVAWRREKYIPKGGPAGGDGGKGGSVRVIATSNHYSLEDYRSIKFIKAKNGGCGGGNNKRGKDGKDVKIYVPLGTLIKDGDTVLHDLTIDGQEIFLCTGGKGGKGNTTFKSPTNRAPDKCTEGTYGEECEVTLELKLIADIGLIGMPNAGKSTLISKITFMPVKIAPYPFTTLRPNLGIVEFDDYKRVLIADIPGIIEDAHNDRGLGLSFLKHIERTSALVYVIDCSGEVKEDPYADFEVLQNELREYKPEALKKPFIVLLNKADILGSDDYIEDFKAKYPYDPESLFVISAIEETLFTDEFQNLDLIKQKMKDLVFDCKNTPLSSTPLPQLACL